MKTKKEKSKNNVSLGKNLLWQSRSISQAANIMVIGFIMIYCTDTLQMPAALVGGLLMASKIFDGITDIFAGFIVDKTNTKLGRGRPYEFAIIGLWLCTWLMFSVPPEFSLVAKSIWVFVMYTLVTGVFATLLNASGNVYMVRAFKSQEQYVTLNSIGAMFVMLGVVVINFLFPILMANLTGSPEGWSTLIAMFAVPLCLIGMIRFFTVKEITNEEVVLTEKLKFKDVLTVFKSNPYIYIVALILFTSAFVSNMGVSVYYFTYVLKDVALMGPFSLIGIIVIPIAIAFPKLIKKFTISRLMIIGILVSSIGYIIFFLAKDNFLLLGIAALISSLGTVPLQMLTGLMIIDCAEYNEWKGKPRLEGTLTSLTSFANKIGAALGTGLLGVMLGAAGFTGSAATVPDSAIMMIRMLASIVPMVLYLVVAVVLLFYKLDEIIPQIRKENEKRREHLEMESKEKIIEA